MQRIVFLGTYAVFTLLHLGGALAKNITTVLVCRLLGGIFGAAREHEHFLLFRSLYEHRAVALTNAGGAISDVWNARERKRAASYPQLRSDGRYRRCRGGIICQRALHGTRLAVILFSIDGILMSTQYGVPWWAVSFPRIRIWAGVLSSGSCSSFLAAFLSPAL